MLTQKEKSGVESILKTLTSDQLTSLAGTVTKGQVVCVTDRECITAILAFEKSGEDFLHRKLISKKILTQYAYKENLQPICDCHSKEDFLRLILKSWSEPSKEVKRYTSERSGSPQQPPQTVHIHNQSVNYYQVNVQVQQQQPAAAVASPAKRDLDYQYGETFCRWFFKMLNHPDPVSQGFGPDVFMPQAQLFTNFVSPGNVTENSYANNINVSNGVLDLCKIFTFNPNISADGLRVKSDPHGLKLVLICGTLFKGTSLCGTFQQSFGMVKDPLVENNWKVQVSALKCSEVQGQQMPSVFNESFPDLERIVATSLERNYLCSTVSRV